MEPHEHKVAREIIEKLLFSHIFEKMWDSLNGTERAAMRADIAITVKGAIDMVKNGKVEDA